MCWGCVSGVFWNILLFGGMYLGAFLGMIWSVLMYSFMAFSSNLIFLDDFEFTNLDD